MTENLNRLRNKNQILSAENKKLREEITTLKREVENSKEREQWLNEDPIASGLVNELKQLREVVKEQKELLDKINNLFDP